MAWKPSRRSLKKTGVYVANFVAPGSEPGSKAGPFKHYNACLRSTEL